MSSPNAADKRITTWLSALSDLVRSDPQQPTTGETISTCATMLARTLPPAAFNTDSLHHAADQFRFWPAFCDLRSCVQKWWNENKPAERDGGRIAGPVALDAEARHWLAYWHRRREEISDPSYTPRRGTVAAELSNLDSFVRDKSPAAWAATGAEAAQDRQPPPDRAAELEAVSAMVAGAFVSQRAPTPQTRRPPVHLTGEALRQSRLARGIAVPPTIEQDGSAA